MPWVIKTVSTVFEEAPASKRKFGKCWASKRYKYLMLNLDFKKDLTYLKYPSFCLRMYLLLFVNAVSKISLQIRKNTYWPQN